MNTSIPVGGTALRGLRWAARSWGVLAIAIVLVIALGEGMNPARFSASEMALFAFFPLGVCIGMAVAWRWERLGGCITVASLCAFYLVHRFFSSHFPHGLAFLALSAPGFLFVICGTWNRLAKER